MKKIIHISIILLFLGCKSETSEIRYYPNDHQFGKKNIEVIGLDTTKLNFQQITNKIGTYYGNYENLMVEFDDGQIKKRITPYIYDGGLIKLKNVLKIKSDSILVDKGYPIDELKRILKKHYLNKGKISFYSDSPERALVEVTIDTNKSGKELKEVLAKLTRSFDEIKTEIDDTIELKVYFDYIRQFPPLPAKPNNETKH